jgi:tape measure domain-containing protein
MGASQLATAYLAIRSDRRALEADLADVRTMVVSSMQGVVSVAGGILASLGVQQLAEGIKGIIGGMVGGNAQLEQYQVSLGVMLKSTEQAKSMMQEIVQFAAVTPFNIPNLMAAVQQMKAYGWETKRLLPDMRIIGDAASASPGGMAIGLERITRALGQMKAKGKVSADEMRQLTEAGVAGWEMLAEAMGTTVADAMAKVRKGTVTADQGIAAILAGMDKRFGGMMEKQSKSFQGLTSTLQDTVGMALAKIGKPLFELTKVRLNNLVDWLSGSDANALIDQLTARMQSLVEWYKQASNSAADFVTSHKDVIVEVGKAVGLIAAASVAVGTLTQTVRILSTAIKVLTFSNPFTAILGVATLAVGAFFTWRKEIEAFIARHPQLQAWVDTVKEFAVVVKNQALKAIESLGPVWEWVKVTASSFWDWIKDVIEQNRDQWSQWGGLVQEIWGNLKRTFWDLFAVVSDVAKAVIDKANEVFHAVDGVLWTADRAE